MEAIISKRGENNKVVGQFFVTYKAQRVIDGSGIINPMYPVVEIKLKHFSAT